MGMKFLNKKGWHTGSLRNIENVWKAEEKHGQEQKKLEELRKQIQEERQRSEFRQLQEQAGLVPRQERLEFLYESGLAVGKGSSSSDVVFQALDPSLPASDNKIVLPPPPSSSAPTQQALVPGALFEEKPQSVNDAWRKLHSDPLLLIRQHEQESLARVKNNPVQMAIIRNSVEAKKGKEKVSKSKEHREKKRHKKKSKHHKYSSEEEETTDDRAAKRSSKDDNKISDNTDYNSEREQRKKHHNDSLPSFEELERSTYARDGGKSLRGGNYISEREERDAQRKNYDRHHDRDLSYGEEERSKNTRGGGDGKSSRGGKAEYISGREERDTQRKNHHHHRDSSDDEKERLTNARGNGKSSRRDDVPDKIKSKYDEKDKVESRIDHDSGRRREKDERHSHHQASDLIQSVHNRRPYNRNVRSSTQLSAEERAAKLREMQIDAEVHEESRWKRIKKADEIDTMQEAANTMRNATSSDNGKNFLDAAKRSVYGAEKGGSATIEESVRRRTHYLQSRSEVGQGNAFRR